MICSTAVATNPASFSISFINASCVFYSSPHATALVFVLSAHTVVTTTPHVTEEATVKEKSSSARLVANRLQPVKMGTMVVLGPRKEPTSQ